MDIQLYDEKTRTQKMVSAEKLARQVGGHYALRALWRLGGAIDAEWKNGDLPKGLTAHGFNYGASSDEEYPIVEAAQTCYRMANNEYGDRAKNASISIKKDWRNAKIPVICKVGIPFYK